MLEVRLSGKHNFSLGLKTLLTFNILQKDLSNFIIVTIFLGKSLDINKNIFRVLYIIGL